MSKLYRFAILLGVVCLIAVAQAAPKPAPTEKAGRASLNVAEVLAIKAQIAEITAQGGDPSAQLNRLNEMYETHRRAGGGRLDSGGETAADATVISSLPYTDTGNNSSSVDDYAVHCGSSGGRDVVYSYTPGFDGFISVSTCGSTYDTEVEIYDHIPGMYSMPLVCNDDWCGLQTGIEGVWLTGAHTYYIVLDAYFSSEVGDYVLHVVNGTIAVGLNNCNNPTPGGETIASAVGIGVGGTICGNTCGMADDYNSTCGSSGGVDAVYYFTAGFTGAVNVALCGSEFDTELYIMDSGGGYLACNDDWCWNTLGPDYSSGIPNFPVVDGQTYYIGVDGYSSSECGIYYLRVERSELACPTADELFAHCVPSNAAIPDVDSVLVNMYMPLNYAIADVNASIDLTHTWDSDLIITLRSPAGTRVILSNSRGGSGDNFHCTGFDDEASTYIGDGTAPFEGDFIPEQPLSAFDGEDCVGSWTLVVSDNVGADVGQILGYCVVISPVSLPVSPNGELTVTDYALHQNYPNPFNPQTNIAFDLAAPGAVRLEVFNTLGQSVSVLFEGTLSAGPHMAMFDASSLPSGVYFYRLQAGSFVDLKKMVLMK